MKSLNYKINKKFHFKVKFNFSSILHNKDQVGRTDKSYSGTDSKHSLGSDRVWNDKEIPPLLKVESDQPIHDVPIKKEGEHMDQSKILGECKGEEIFKEKQNKDDVNSDKEK